MLSGTRVPGSVARIAFQVTIGLAVSLLAPRTTTAHPHPVDPVAARAALGRLVESRRLPEARWPNLSDVQDDLRILYQRSRGDLLWTRLGGPTLAAQAAIAQLENAADLGLSPDDYDASALRLEAEFLLTNDQPPTPREAAAFDVGLSTSALRFVAALHHGRVSPRAVHATLDLAREPFDGPAIVDSLRRLEDPRQLLESIQPPFLHYRLLRESLARYRRMARDSGLVPLPRWDAPLRPAAAYRGAGALRRLLHRVGDLPAGPAVAAGADTLYDSTLAAAVRRFQRRHGFTADGVVGTMTERALNAPFTERIRQIELTLERWRWMPRRFRSLPVIVNVPAFQLHAFRSADDREADLLTMDVQVGQAFRHRTPLFAADLRYLVFRPYWEVTTTIARREILPRARRDPGYLARERLELLRGYGEDADVVPPTPENVARIGREIRVRQKPGPGNALGDVKFVFPNQHDVYMHDTPAKSLFEKARRDFSHGCIRLSRPLELATFLLRDRPEWTAQRTRAALASDRPTTVPLARPVPVYIVYGTVIAREDGRVFFYPDLYGYDLELERLLARGYPYPR